MKKQILLLSLLGCSVVGCQAEVPPVTAPSANSSISPKWQVQADGFASVDALDQKGTTGGAGGKIVTVDNLADWKAMPKRRSRW